MPHHFIGQKPYEKVVLVLRRHWIVLLGILLVFLFLASLPFILYALLEALTTLDEQALDLFWFATIVYFLFWWYGLFYQLTDYILDTWIVTDHRIVDIEQQGLFRRNVAETALPLVQDVTVNTAGFFPTIFTYGYVYVQTAGPMREIVFQQVSDPVRVKDVILHLYYKYQQEHKDGIEIHESTLHGP